MQLSDLQVMTLAISVAVPISLLIYSNSRITDAKETLRAEIQTLKVELQAMRAEIKTAIDRLDTSLKIHELEHHK